MITFSSRSIADNIRLSILTTAVVAVVVSGSFVIASEYVLFRDNFIENITSVAEVLSINVTAPLVFDDEREARETLAALGAVAGIEQGYIVDATGSVFATFIKQGRTVTDLTSINVAEGVHRTGEGKLLVAVPVNFDSEKIATLVIQASFAELYSKL